MNERYWVIKADSAEALEKAVDEAIDSGWNPTGGMSVVANPDGTHTFFQATLR